MNNQNPIEHLALECRDVTKEYKDGDLRIKVLNGISLSVSRGEQIAIMGRSGSGKSTLLQILGGLDNPSSGRVCINGQDLKNMKCHRLERLRNRSLGFIYQMHHLLPEFSALENVAMPLLIAKIPPKEASARAMQLLDQVGLGLRLNHRPSELSGGERQRVAIARALINNPDCVLADEPTGNLDEENAMQIFEVLQALNRRKNTSLIIVTHDPGLALKMDRTLLLQGGHLS